MTRILIADDSTAARRALSIVLQGNGWEVCGEAEDGLAAVEKAAILKPDLVILDFKMPKMNGLQAGRTIHAADPHMPLLLFTLDKIDPYLGEEARKSGFRGALAEGEGIFALSQAVEELIQGRTFFLPVLPTRSPADLEHGTQSAASQDGTNSNPQSAREEQTH
jgi:DNA-binding NarL/FixJ family response regulator